METTAANVHDVTVVPDLTEGTEEDFHGDSGYTGVEKREDTILTNKDGNPIQYIVCACPSSLKKRCSGKDYEAAVAAEHAKSSVRCKVEHVFAVVKGMFRFRKIRLRGLQKVDAQFLCSSLWRTLFWLRGLPLQPDCSSLRALRSA